MKQQIIPGSLLLLSFFTGSASLQAQQQTIPEKRDSVLIESTGMLFSEAYHFFNTDAALLSQSRILQHNQIGLSYQRETGRFRLAQAPEKSNTLQFQTYGTRKAGRFLLSGHFRYTNSTIDSLGNTLAYSPQLPYLSAYYFYAVKKGNWTYGSYQLQAIASTKLLQNKLNISLGIDYRNSTADRSNDPRPSKRTFQVAVAPVLGWQVSSRHQVHGGLLAGFNKDQLNVTYKNDAYQLSSLYPDYTNYLVMGYGFIRKWTSNLTIRDHAGEIGVTGGYSGQLNWGQLAVSGFWKTAEHDFFKSSMSTVDNRIEYGTQSDDVRGGKLWWALDKANRQYRFQANYTATQTRNYAYLLAGSNYGATYDEIDLMPVIGQRSAGKLRNEFGLQARYRYLDRRDGNAGVVATNEWLQLGLQHFHYYYWGQKNSLQLQWQAAYRFSMYSDIVVPDLQKTLFSDNVIFPDYQYYRTGAYVLGAGLDYRFITKAGLVKVHAHAGYDGAAEEGVANGMVYPRAGRLHINTGISFLF